MSDRVFPRERPRHLEDEVKFGTGSSAWKCSGVGKVDKVTLRRFEDLQQPETAAKRSDPVRSYLPCCRSCPSVTVGGTSHSLRPPVARTGRPGPWGPSALAARLPDSAN